MKILADLSSLIRLAVICLILGFVIGIAVSCHTASTEGRAFVPRHHYAWTITGG